MGASEAKKKADAKWQKANIKQVKFNLNITTDKDIIDWLNSIDNKQGYFKELIRKDIKAR